MEVLDDGKGYPQGFSLLEDIHQTGGLHQQPDPQHLGSEWIVYQLDML